MKVKAVLILFCLGTCLAISASAQQVIYVPDDYLTIQEAVNLAGSGDTIMVREGIYFENVKVNKNLVIKSEKGAESTIVEAADADDYVFEIKVGYVEINGFTIKGALGDKKSGIYLRSAANDCQIINNICLDNYCGIGLASNYNQIEGNICQSNSKSGIVLASSFGNKIVNNICLGSEYGIGISEKQGTCAIEQVIHQSKIANSQETLSLIRKFRDGNLKREYVELYYEYSPDLKRILIKEPDLAIEVFKLMTKYLPAIRYLLNRENGTEIEMTQNEIEEIISFTEKLKGKINEEKLTIGVKRSQEISSLLKEFKEEISLSEGKKFSQMFRSSPYFALTKTKSWRIQNNQARHN
ncbi:MAG TPA: hypothetical protein ENI16_00940, partial [Candidatus Portnoybacteria bacterium]|nr:hypothetical protein [Candidatus Portnoybacteria bacterium]